MKQLKMSWFLSVCCLATIFPMLLEGGKTSQHPNIIFILADDLGWDDVGFHGSDQIPTPNIDTLAYDGIILNNYYVQPICTPSRSALMTGRHPIHIGMQHSVLMESEKYGLGLDEKLLPEYLRELGYATHIVGKWHLGYFDDDYLPTNRGFDTHFGYYQGCGDYWDHTYTNGEHTPNKWGLDFWNNTIPVKTCYGEYSTELFTSRTEEIIAQHDTSKPLFMYLPHQAVHSGNPITPLEAPWKYLKNLDHITQEQRRLFGGMLSALDDSIGNVTKALDARGMLNNTIIAFSTDNGGPAAGFDMNMACNYPLRGVKNTMWEGGMRGAGFLWSPLLDTSGYVSDLMMQIFDWFPTLLSAAGYDMSKIPDKVDGMDMWAALSDDADHSPRTEMMHNLDPLGSNKFALRVADMKLIGGPQGMSGWYKPGEKSLNKDGSPLPRELYESENNAMHVDMSQKVSTKAPGWMYKSKITPILSRMGRSVRDPHPVVVDCGPKPASASTNCKPSKAPCLFNITSDPCEYNNLADKHPETVQKLLDRLAVYNATMVPPRNKPVDPQGFPEYHKGIWAPWVNVTDKQEEIITF